jgi:hypothetical protein
MNVVQATDVEAKEALKKSAKKLTGIGESARSVYGDMSSIVNRLHTMLAPSHTVSAVLPLTSLITLAFSSIFMAFSALFVLEGSLLARSLIALTALSITGISIGLLIIMGALVVPMLMLSTGLRATQYAVRFVNAFCTHWFGKGKVERLELHSRKKRQVQLNALSKNLKATALSTEEKINKIKHSQFEDLLNHFPDAKYSTEQKIAEILLDVESEYNTNAARIQALKVLQHDRICDIGKQGHNVIQCLIALAGITLLLFPATAPIGMIIAAAVSAYDILDCFGYNPVKWLAYKAFGYVSPNLIPNAEQKTAARLSAVKNAVICGIGLMGVAMLFFPSTLPVGIAVVAAVSTYTVAERLLGKDPIKWFFDKCFKREAAPIKTAPVYRSKPEMRHMHRTLPSRAASPDLAPSAPSINAKLNSSSSPRLFTPEPRATSASSSIAQIFAFGNC